MSYRWIRFPTHLYNKEWKILWDEMFPSQILQEKIYKSVKVNNRDQSETCRHFNNNICFSMLRVMFCGQRNQRHLPPYIHINPECNVSNMKTKQWIMFQIDINKCSVRPVNLGSNFASAPSTGLKLSSQLGSQTFIILFLINKFLGFFWPHFSTFKLQLLIIFIIVLLVSCY